MSVMIMELIERENEIIGVMEKIKDLDVILVGGYAVSSLTVHRHSVDCEFVVSKSAGEIKAILKKML